MPAITSAQKISEQTTGLADERFAARFPIVNYTATATTASLVDANAFVTHTNGSAVAYTIPPASSVDFPIGTTITVRQGGAGAVTITAGAGVTLQGIAGSAATSAANEVAFVTKVAANTWVTY